MPDRPTQFVTESGDDERGAPTGAEPKRGTSRWQKVVAIIGLVVLVLLGMRMFASGGHGPGPGQGQQQKGGHQPPAWVPDH